MEEREQYIEIARNYTSKLFKTNKVSGKELAKILGCSLSTIWYKNREQNYTIPELIKISDALDKTLLVDIIEKDSAKTYGELLNIIASQQRTIRVLIEEMDILRNHK